MKSSTSRRRRTWEGRASTSTSVSRFYNIILEETVRDKKLLLPRKFVENHGQALPSRMVLRLPTGVEWQVQVVKDGNVVWLEKDWQDFADYYSIKFGHFLLFEYGGCPEFSVRIFDMSATEIPYQLWEAQGQGTDEGEDSDCIEVSHCDEDTESIIEISDDNLPTKKSLAGEKKFKALEKAAFQSENPFFKLVIQPSYLAGGNRLNVPSKFSRMYIRDPPGEVILRVSDKPDRREWRVQYFYDEGRGKWRVKFLGGWNAFTVENHLKPYDVCVFELTKRNPMEMKVYVFRDGRRVQSTSLPGY